MRAVQRRESTPRHAVGRPVLTGLAGLLILGALNVPGDLQALGPGAFLRLPLEALVYLSVVLALPRSLGPVRTVLAAVVGFLVGLLAILRLLDMGFLQTLDRPFDALVDWRYAGSFVSLVRDSVGERLGTVLLLAVVLVAALLLGLLPLALLRVTRAADRHRGASARVLAAGTALWVALALLDVRGTSGVVATSDTGAYLYGQVSRIPGELRDQQAFADAATEDPPQAAPGRVVLGALRGKDVVVVFVESYGRAALEGSWFAPRVRAVLAESSQQLAADGFTARSAWLTSPTFGGISWLAHATLQSGLWVDSQARYDVLVKSPRLTLSRLFGRAGWRSVAVVPANNRDWPQGAFYGFDRVYDSRNIGYEGPRFGYPTMPDQFTLDALYRLELARNDRRPVMAEVDLLSSHTPWTRTPHLIDQSAVGDGSVYDGMPETLPSHGEVWSSPRRVQEAYGRSVEYSLRALTRFITTYGDDDTVVIFLGDHQPAAVVSGTRASHDVPVTILARDRRVLTRISPWGWADGLRPSAGSPVWRMDRFRDRFLSAYTTSRRPTPGGAR